MRELKFVKNKMTNIKLHIFGKNHKDDRYDHKCLWKMKLKSIRIKKLSSVKAVKSSTITM